MKKILITLLVCCTFLKAGAAELTWLTNMPKAMAQAKAEHKLVLADFTGSDWCVWCKKLDADTLSKQQFADYAKTNLVLVQLDYPNKPQPAELKAANAVLQKRFKIEGFPTLILMKPDATVLWRIDGYLEGGPKALIAKLDEAKKK
jgi:thioredoxin-related protein